MKRKRIDEWLNSKFVEWMRSHGRRKTMRAFAEWLGVKEGLVSQWMSGRNNPVGDNVHKIARRLGPEIYDLLGLARPDPPQALIEIVDKLPADLRSDFVKAADRISQEMKDR